jgi:hypothetical protein
VAARKNLTQLARTREEIRGSELMGLMRNQSLSKCDMTLSQVSVPSAALFKSVPDLRAVKAQAEVSYRPDLCQLQRPGLDNPYGTKGLLGSTQPATNNFKKAV